MQKDIDDSQGAITCCLCDYKAHKKCNKLRSKNFVSVAKKSQFPICIDCKRNTLPFQNQYVEKNENENNSNDPENSLIQ